MKRSLSEWWNSSWWITDTAVCLLLVYVHALDNDRFSSPGEDNRVIVRTLEGWILSSGQVAVSSLGMYRSPPLSQHRWGEHTDVFLTGEGGDVWVWCDRRREVMSLELPDSTNLTVNLGSGDQMIASPIRATYLRATSITWPCHTPITQNAPCLLWPAMPK